jgi:hypothetical protein
MKPIDYAEELQSIRAAYVGASPKQRLHVIRQRLANPDHAPNVMVTRVSAVEALARSLASHQAGKSPSGQYARLRNEDPDRLVELVLACSGAGTPKEVFGTECWQLFRHAVNYRNMIVHECTYLGQDKSPHLEKACETVLEKLVEIGGLSAAG